MLVGAAGQVEGLAVIVDEDVDDRGEGPAEPVRTPGTGAVLPVPAIASVDTDLDVGGGFVQGDLGGQGSPVEQGAVSLVEGVHGDQDAGLVGRRGVQLAQLRVEVENLAQVGPKSCRVHPLGPAGVRVGRDHVRSDSGWVMAFRAWAW